jgi:glycogen(starch) synthase
VLASDRDAERAPGGEPEVFRQLRPYWSAGQPVSLTPPRRFQRERQNASTLAHHLREFRPDVVTWWGMAGVPLSLIEQVRSAGVPAVAFVGDDWLNYAPPGDPWMRMFTTRPLLGQLVKRVTGVPTRVNWSQAATYVFVSEATRRAAPPLADTAVEYPGISDRFLVVREQPPWSWRLFSVGRLDPRKGFATAIEALAELPEATLTIAGGGPEGELSRLRAVAGRFGVADRINWRGPTPHEQLPAVYAEHDALLFPVIWPEPFGLVPLEAMGVGRPVIATGRGGSAEYLRDEENCLFHEAEDARGLAAAVRRLASDRALAEHLRTQGRRTAERFTSARFEAAAVAHLLAVADGQRGRLGPP